MIGVILLGGVPGPEGKKEKEKVKNGGILPQTSGVSETPPWGHTAKDDARYIST